MNELLRSKTFRKNLSKWIFLYIAVMCLLTSVITYSKYITKMSNTDEARASKFEVNIKPMSGEECTMNIENNTFDCPLTAYRPTKPIIFYFEVDATQMEVLADLYVRASVDEISDLLIKKIELVDKDKVIKDDLTASSLSDNRVLVHSVVNPENKSSLKYYYKVTAEYDLSELDKIDDAIIYSINNEKENLKIGFSAKQITNKN